VLRSISVYIFIVVAIRLFGKKELAQLSVVDLVFILLISNSVQNAMVGADTSLLGGLIAAVSLFSVNLILKYSLFRNKKFNELLQGNPIMLVHKGKIIHPNFDKLKITHEELDAAIREHGIDKISHVDLAILEVDGSISVLSNNYEQKTHIRRKRVHKSLKKDQ
jgi:uncharacterized membrane protein YcaP (DUF421 family)